MFAGKVIVCDSRSPFEMAAPSEDWAVSLLGFGWLRHLRAAETAITRANARALVDEWIALNSAQDPIAWRPDVVARRVISWLSQAPLVLDDADAQFYRRFLRSLARQVRHLRHTVSQARDGVPRLRPAIALCYAALCMARQQRTSAPYKRLAEEARSANPARRRPYQPQSRRADRVAGRSPAPAHCVHRAQHSPPAALLNAVDRMMPMLRFFRHGDSNFAPFNGMGPTPTDVLTTILAYDDARGAAGERAAFRLPAPGERRHARAGGYRAGAADRRQPGGACRLSGVRTLGEAERIVVNCGLPATSRSGWRQVAAPTAHSTVTFEHLVRALRRIGAGQAPAQRHAHDRRGRARSR